MWKDCCPFHCLSLYLLVLGSIKITFSITPRRVGGCFRDLQAWLPLSAEPIVRNARSSAQGKFRSKLDNLPCLFNSSGSLVFLHLNRKLPHCCQFSRIHLWATACRAPKAFYWGRHNVALASLADFKLGMVQEIIFL